MGRSAKALLRSLKQATEKTEKQLYKADLRVPVAIIVGSEEKGVSASLIKISDQLISIPMKGTIGSLNVSVAAGMMLYEVLRQRETGSK